MRTYTDIVMESILAFADIPEDELERVDVSPGRMTCDLKPFDVATKRLQHLQMVSRKAHAVSINALNNTAIMMMHRG